MKIFGNIAECVRKLRTNFGRREAPLESGPAIELQKMPILARKSSFQMKLILIHAGILTSTIVAFGAQKIRTHTLKSRRILVYLIVEKWLIGCYSYFAREWT